MHDIISGFLTAMPGWRGNRFTVWPVERVDPLRNHLCQFPRLAVADSRTVEIGEAEPKRGAAKPLPLGRQILDITL